MAKDHLKYPKVRSSGPRSPADFGALSHLILDCANRDEPKVDFLAGIARLLLTFSGCDTVAIIVSEGRRSSHCRATRRPDGTVTIDATAVSMETGCDSSRKLSGLEQLRLHVMTRRASDTPTRFFTPYGSFWTGNANELVTLPPGPEKAEEGHSFELGEGFLSLALIPSEVSQERVGLLELQSKRRRHFRVEDIRLYETIAQTLGMALVNQRIQSALRERVKELTCLYGIATLSKQSDLPLEQILQQIADLLPKAWQYPRIAHSRILFDDREFRSAGYIGGDDVQSATIVVEGKQRGAVEICYAESKSVLDEGPFLTEERNLINAVAVQLAMIVEQREDDEKRLRLQAQLRHSDRLATIGQMVAGVAHELNEPLGSILGFAQLAKKSPHLVEHVAHDIDRIVKAALHAREVVKKLMLFSRQTPLRKTQVDLNNLIREEMYFLESRCAKSGIEMRQVLAPNLPKITADPSQLFQVLVNLSVNAIQAMPNGGVLTVKTGKTDQCVSLTVEDTGAGMSPEVLERIFIPFFSTKDANEGTGLGLPVVLGIVSSHAGTIKVQSKVGKGSQFVVNLPVSSTEEEETSKRHD